MTEETKWMKRMDDALGQEVIFGMRKAEMMEKANVDQFSKKSQGWLADLQDEDRKQRAMMTSFMHGQADAVQNSIDAIDAHVAAATQDYSDKTQQEIDSMRNDAHVLEGET